MNYTIYSQATGQILRVVQTNDIESQIQTGEAYIDGSVDDSAYYIENDEPVAIPPNPSQYAEFNFSTKQWILNENLAIANVLQKRQKLLYASDWTQIPNGPLTSAQQESWATYRQELRDIPSQSGYPYNVIWPTPPQG
jgi:hypothetical protein